MNSHLPIRILLVEDNPGDVVLTREAFRHAGLTNDLVVARNGEEALVKLGINPDDTEGPLLPTKHFDLVIVDLNLPVLDGRELIEIFMQSETLRDIPIIIMTNSLDDRQLTVHHMLSTKTYLEKPINIFRLYEALQSYPQFNVSIGLQAHTQNEGGNSQTSGVTASGASS